MNYSIDIRSLKQGLHAYDFQIDKKILQVFECDFIEDLAVEARVTLERLGEIVKVKCELRGELIVVCDNCLENMTHYLEVEVPLLIRFAAGEEEDSLQDEVIMLDRSETVFELDQIFYDYICLDLPLRNVHPDGECNPLMVEKMNSILK